MNRVARIATQGPTHCINRHIYVCRRGSNALILDLKRDRYLGVEDDGGRLLSERIVGWPVHESHTFTSGLLPTTVDETVDELTRSQILTTDLARGKSATPVNIPVPSAPLIDGYEVVPFTIRIEDVALLAWYAATVFLSLRWRPFERLVSGIYRRAHRESLGSASAEKRSHKTLRELQREVAKFIRLRPLFYTANRACLLDSLVLFRFLSWRGFQTRLVFGVATEPFAAHCWLQFGDVVINDAPDHVQKFTPIMCV